MSGAGVPRPRGASLSAERPEMAVKMDYSNIYRENEELEDHLEDQIDDIHKNKYRAWQEKRQQLKVIKQQVEVIMRLRAAVNSRRPGESIEIVASSRPRRASRPSISRAKSEEKKEIDIDVAEMAQNNKTQIRISMEREKFSSKNLFNVRRKNRGLGGMFENHHTTNNTNNKHLSTQATPFSVEGTGGNFFTRRQTAIKINDIHGDVSREENSNSNNHTGDYFDNSDNYSKRSGRPSSDRPRTAYSTKTKSYMQGTVSSRKGARPKTAMGISSEKGLQADGESASPSRLPSAKRCRSRRELELLSRLKLAPTDDKGGKSDRDDDVDDESRAAGLLKQSRRNAKLQQLRRQSHELQTRVDSFLQDIHGFNKDRRKTNFCDKITHNKHGSDNITVEFDTGEYKEELV